MPRVALHNGVPFGPRRTVMLVCAGAALAALALLDAFIGGLHMGALVVIPLLVIAYYTRPIVGMLLAAAAAPVFSALDHDVVARVMVTRVDIVVDAVILAVSFGVALLVVGRLRKHSVDYALLQSRYEGIRALAERDSLTDLPNRRAFEERLATLVMTGEATGERHGILFCDLNRFKLVNDAHGHVTGDTLLSMVAMRLKGALRGNDVIARIGGDEFAALVEGIHSDGELAAVEAKLVAAMEAPFVIDGNACQVGIAIGQAIYPEDGRDPQTLTNIADQRMYERKRALNAAR